MYAAKTVHCVRYSSSLDIEAVSTIVQSRVCYVSGGLRKPLAVYASYICTATYYGQRTHIVDGSDHNEIFYSTSIAKHVGTRIVKLLQYFDYVSQRCYYYIAHRTVNDINNSSWPFDDNDYTIVFRSDVGKVKNSEPPRAALEQLLCGYHYLDIRLFGETKNVVI